MGRRRNVHRGWVIDVVPLARFATKQRLAAGLISRNKSKRTCSMRGAAGVIRVVHTIEDRHLQEVERAYAIKASNVYAILVFVRSALMVRVYPAVRAEKVLR